MPPPCFGGGELVTAATDVPPAKPPMWFSLPPMKGRPSGTVRRESIGLREWRRSNRGSVAATKGSFGVGQGGESDSASAFTPSLGAFFFF